MQIIPHLVGVIGTLAQSGGSAAGRINNGRNVCAPSRVHPVVLPGDDPRPLGCQHLFFSFFPIPFQTRSLRINPHHHYHRLGPKWVCDTI